MDGLTSVVVAVVSAVIGLFGYQAIQKYRVNKGQANLEDKVKANAEKTAAANQQIKDIDKQTAEVVKQVEQEQAKTPTAKDLVDFFNNRK